MSGLRRGVCGWVCWRFLGVILAIAAVSAPPANAQQRRQREPNSVYAERRAKLASSIDGPVVLLGYTGKEEEAQNYIFAQEENFYYLTGHNEEEAALVLLPPDGSKAKKNDWQGPREIFFLPPKDPRKEKWNGVRMAPGDPGIEARKSIRTSTRYFPTRRNWADTRTSERRRNG